MATASKVSIVSDVCFRLKVLNVSELNESFSPAFLIKGVPWLVSVTKTMDETEDLLSVRLFCKNNDVSSQWSYAAVASFKLLPFNGNASVKKYLEPYVFDHTGLTSGSASIRWADLLDIERNYVRHDAIILEIQIDVANPNDDDESRLVFTDIDNCCEEGRVGTFRLAVTNIDKLIAVRSTEFKLRSVPWYLTIFKHSAHLGVRLDSRNSSNDIICNVDASVKLITLNGNMQTIQRIQAKQIHRKEGIVMERLITWDDLFNSQNGFIRNGADITLEIEINADKPEVVTPHARKRRATRAAARAKTTRMECSICTGRIETQDVSCTPCGHIFCTACILNSIQIRKICPICNTKVLLRQVRSILLPM